MLEAERKVEDITRVSIAATSDRKCTVNSGLAL